jgi:uncharacterized protein YuzE
MKAHYDREVDALSIRLVESPVVESEEIRPGFILDLDENDEVVGIEILGLRNRRPTANPVEMDFEVLGASAAQASP